LTTVVGDNVGRELDGCIAVDDGSRAATDEQPHPAVATRIASVDRMAVEALGINPPDARTARRVAPSTEP
jgi:hypothetical protein